MLTAWWVKTWPNGEVPYEIQDFDREVRKLILEAMDEIMKKTGVIRYD